MDLSSRKVSSPRQDNTSLGILNMDSLKGRGRFFGDLSYKNQSNSVDHRRISDRLNMERKKALETLQKSSDVFKRPHQITANKENMRSIMNNTSSATNGSMSLETTDYVPFRRPDTIDISNLVTDETINLEITSSNPPSACKEGSISFEPTEITGRSTLYKKDLKQPRMGKQTKHISVNDILASSFAPKARNLCETLYGGETSLELSAEADKLLGISTASSSTACTSFNGKSLPRTADMSMSRTSLSQLSLNGEALGTFSFSAGAGTSDLSGFSNEEFAPGELMQSKLINDEISWAEQYAAIPTKTLSEQAKAKVATHDGNPFDSPSASNSMIAGDPNFSVGNFFYMRSEQLQNIIKTKSPDKCRTPFSLVDEDDSNVVSSSNSDMVTPKVDNKAYTRVAGQTTELNYESLLSLSAIDRALGTFTDMDTPKVDNKTYTRVAGQTTELNHESLLSLSAIDRAIENLDLQRHSFMNGEKSKSGMTNNPFDKSKRSPRSNAVSSQDAYTELSSQEKHNLTKVNDILMENKENLDPDGSNVSGTRPEYSDTLSFTDSILNSSDMKQLQRSPTQKLPRSPLSPIDVATSMPNIRVNGVADGDEGTEADVEEWPSTPIQESRRVRRKSPRDRRQLLSNINDDEANATTPVNSRSACSYNADQIAKTRDLLEPKSLCSTRLDGDPRKATADCDFGISPNLSASKSVSTLVVRSNSNLSPCPPSKYLENASPLSSLSSRGRNLTPSSSPTPNMDTTSNSERQLLCGAGAVRKIVSSPAGSEASSTCSYSTMHSARSAASSSTNMRSISQCSSSSEFSHRDGKKVPLKVTTLELSWASVKLRSDSRKSMQIKNIINKRLVIRLGISGPGFQLVNNQRNHNISLQPQECHSINISFCPTVCGVAIGKLSFYAPTNGTSIGQSFLDVALYAYGGHASVVPQNILLGPVGSPFITMGHISELSQTLERTVRFYNKGPLLAFAVISIDCMGLMLPRLSEAFEIYPKKILIPPQHVVEARIIFKPKREEKIVKKMSNVLTLANMRVICGDEANRQRIRQLLQQMNERERSRMSSSVLDMLWTTFEDEVEIKELNNIKENPSIAMDLASGFRIHEISLTINYDNMDDTAEASSLFLSEVNETVLFRTIVCAADSPTPSLSTVNEMYDI